MPTLHLTAFDQFRALFGAASDAVIAAASAHLTQRPAPVAPMPKLLQPASAEERSQADELVGYLLAQVPYAVGAAVIDAITGLPLAHGGAPGEQNPVSYAMQLGRIARRTAALAAAVGPDERVEELVLPCGPCTHVLRLAPSGKHWVYLAVNTHDLNLGIVRELLRELTHEGPVTAG